MVLSESDRKVMEDHALQAVNREMFQHCAWLILDRRPSIAQVGSGVCIAIDEHRFVATAAHNLEGRSPDTMLMVYGPSRPQAPAETPSILRIESCPSLDIGLVELDPRTCGDSDDASFLGLERCDPGVDHAPGQASWVHGFPAASVPRELWVRGLAIGRPLLFLGETVSEEDWPPRKRRDPGVDIAIEYPSELEVVDTASGASDTFDSPSFYGFSGCGMWRTNSQPDGAVWSPRSRLIGIQHSWRRERRHLYGTQIQHWLELVSANYPDLRGSIDQVRAE